jgi:hypothetical protein
VKSAIPTGACYLAVVPRLGGQIINVPKLQSGTANYHIAFDREVKLDFWRRLLCVAPGNRPDFHKVKAAVWLTLSVGSRQDNSTRGQRAGTGMASCCWKLLRKSDPLYGSESSLRVGRLKIVSLLVV